jgi:SAM-dependent methyltransferase
MLHQLPRKLLSKVFINSSRIYLFKYNQEFALNIEPGKLVLDAGAGDAPYKELFKHTKYETADKFSESSTYVCDLISIPVEDERFDFIVFNQVLEHLPEPKQVLKELARILKPGGKMICTVPLFYEEHLSPYDFYRYTQFAHNYLFKEAGLNIERLEWLEGYFGTVAYQLKTASKYLPVNPNKLGGMLVGVILSPIIFIVKIIFLLLAFIFYRIDINIKFTSMGFPKNYVIIARK